MRNKLYLAIISKQVFNNKVSIIGCNIFDTIEEAMKFGKVTISDDCYNNSLKDLDTNNEILLFIKNCKDLLDIDYKIRISIVSTNRKRFNTSKEIMEYFNTNIKNITNDNLYDFLLSLVESDDYVYDYEGNLLYHQIQDQSPILESGYSNDIDFDIESCKTGKYTFVYH